MKKQEHISWEQRNSRIEPDAWNLEVMMSGNPELFVTQNPAIDTFLTRHQKDLEDKAHDLKQQLNGIIASGVAPWVLSGILIAATTITHTHLPVVDGFFHLTHNPFYSYPFITLAYFANRVPNNENKIRMLRLQDAQTIRRVYGKQKAV